MNKTHRHTVIIFVCIFMFGLDTFAQISPASPGVQAILYSKIFSYVRDLDDNERSNILLVYDAKGRSPDQMVEAFKKENINARTVSVEQLAGIIKNYSILYIMDGIPVSRIKKNLQNAKVLTITGSPGLVETGEASIGVGIEKDKFKILINMSQLQKEEHMVSSELIGLAKIFR